MDFGAYARVSHGIQYRRITGLYALSDDRVVEQDVLDMHAASPDMADWGDITRLILIY